MTERKPTLDELFGEAPVGRRLHPAQLPEDELLASCRMDRGKTSGPGGQHRNKVATAVTLTHEPTGISGHASERREPEVNRKVALRRLRLNLATEHREPVPSGDARSELWRMRCKDRKVVVSERHADLAAMIAEALDFVYASGLDAKKAAVRLECSMSQLLKLIAKHPAAFGKLNTDRESRGMHKLKL